MRHQKRHILLLLAFGVFFLPFLLEAQEDPTSEVAVNVLQDDFAGKYLGLKTYYLESSEGIEIVSSEEYDLKFTLSEKSFINRGFRDDTVWFRTTFYNPGTEDYRLYIHDSQNIYDVFKIYVNGKLEADWKFENPLYDRTHSIMIPPKSSVRVYIEKQTLGTPNKSSWTFWSNEVAMLRSISNSMTLFVLTQTIYAMSTLFAIMLFLTYRKSVYAYYMGYLVIFMGFNGWVWSPYYVPGLTEYGGLTPPVEGVFSALYIISFLEIDKKTKPIRYSLFIPPLWVFAIGCVISPFNLSMGLLISNINVLIAGGLAFIMGCYTFAQQREFHILLFVIAFGTFLTGSIVQALFWIGLIPYDVGPIMFYSVAIENVLMLSAMGYKIYRTEKDRVASFKAMKHSYAQLGKVFYPHQIASMEAGNQLEDSMPVGEHSACVISFDIASSTKIVAEGKQQFFRAVFAKCGEIMSENYRHRPLQANAFRVKELGDGFLCTVGFPFKSIGENPFEESVRLSNCFLAAFCSKISELDSEEDVHCGMGIAYGPIEAFYPESPPIEYDLFGEGIVMATRYEQMRKVILKRLGIMGNIIILQSQVYENLSETTRSTFTEFDLIDEGVEVRDDSEAVKLYYRVLSKHQVIAESEPLSA